MPVLGHAGYLPFGLACIVIGQLIEPLHATSIPTDQGNVEERSEKG